MEGQAARSQEISYDKSVPPSITPSSSYSSNANMVQKPVRDRSVRGRIKASLRARWPAYPFVLCLVILSWAVGNKIQGRERFFVERDPSLSYPYVGDTVPSWSLAFIGGLGPIVIIILTQVFIRRSAARQVFERRTKDIHLAIVVLGEVLAVTWLVTNILKCYVGRLRPNFYAYCDYKGYRAAVLSGDITDYLNNTVPGQIGDFSYCRDDHLDAHFSFPSGHSSISFCGLTFLTLFLLHVTSRVNFRHHSVGKIVRSLIVLIPLFAAAIVAGSRVIDYMHNVEDTVWGSLIGFFGAFLVFHANYAYTRPGEEAGPIGPYTHNHTDERARVGDFENVRGKELEPTTESNYRRKINASSPLVTRAPTQGSDNDV